MHTMGSGPRCDFLTTPLPHQIPRSSNPLGHSMGDGSAKGIRNALGDLSTSGQSLDEGAVV